MIANDTAPGSGCPMLRSASGRALPSRGVSAAVASAASAATAAASPHRIGNAGPEFDPAPELLVERDERIDQGLVAEFGAPELLDPRATRMDRICKGGRVAAPRARGRRPIASSAAPHSAPEVPPARSAHAAPARRSCSPTPRLGSVATAAAVAASIPRSMPTPWSPSPAIASRSPSSSARSAIASTHFPKQLRTRDRGRARGRRCVTARRLGSSAAAGGAPSPVGAARAGFEGHVSARERRAPRLARSTDAPARRRATSASAETPAMSRLVTSSPHSGLTISIPSAARMSVRWR